MPGSSTNINISTQTKTRKIQLGKTMRSGNSSWMNAGLKTHTAGIVLVVKTAIKSNKSTTKSLGCAELNEVPVNKSKSCTDNG